MLKRHTEMAAPYIILKKANTRSHITLKQIVLALQNLAQMCSYNSINILESKSVFNAFYDMVHV